MMSQNLPRAVQRQLDEAEALAAAQAQPPVTVTDPAQLVAPPAPVPAPAPVPTPAPAPEPAPPAPPVEDFQQKYRTVQGMLAAERAKALRVESEAAALRQQLEAMRQAPQTPAPAPQQAQEPAIDPRDERTFGADMVEMVQKYAKQTFAALGNQFSAALTGLDQRLSKLEAAIGSVSQRTESTMESQFYATLSQLVPDWEAINQQADWVQWLAETDPVYGLPRQAALDVAFDKKDAARCASIFSQFKASRPAKPSQALATQVSPSEGGGGAVTPQAPAPKPMISEKAIQSFYRDIERGKYRGREAEAERIEAEINLAAREGRITK